MASAKISPRNPSAPLGMMAFHGAMEGGAARDAGILR
jgi:hypothetical protein